MFPKAPEQSSIELMFEYCMRKRKLNH